MTTHIAIVMDRSGSMKIDDLHVEAAGSTNAFVDELKDIPGKKYVTINIFDDHFDTICSGVAQSKVPKIVAGKNYVPRGMTSLYDAIGKTINGLGKKKNVVVCVVTDGMENSSKEFTYENIQQMISEKTELGWKFDFLSSDLQAMQLGMGLGFNEGMKVNKTTGVTEDFHFTASAAGYESTVLTRSASLADYITKNEKK